MPTISVSEKLDRQLCPTGPGIFRLKSIEEKQMKKFNGAEGETAPRLIWTFVKNEKAPDGTFYEVAVFSGTRYGNEQAKLTWLLDMIDPGISTARIKAEGGLNTDKYLDNVYEAGVKHTLADNGDTYANFVWLKPIGQPARAEPSADLFDSPDPGAVVACEVCQAELTDMEAIACAKRWGDAARLCTTHGRERLAEEKRAVRQAEDAVDPFVAA